MHLSKHMLPKAEATKRTMVMTLTMMLTTKLKMATTMMMKLKLKFWMKIILKMRTESVTKICANSISNSCFCCSRCTERVFGQQQWQTLRTKLATWRGNIANVINTIQANKMTEDGAQAVQGLMIR